MIKDKIVLIPFPFDDWRTTKVRPALCLTDPIGEFEHIVLAYISSQVPDVLLDSDILIDWKSRDFAMTGLKVSSNLRLHRLITIPSVLIKRELGTLSPLLSKKVSAKLIELFKLKINQSY